MRILMMVWTDTMKNTDLHVVSVHRPTDDLWVTNLIHMDTNRLSARIDFPAGFRQLHNIL
jgi:hypothetical protein